MWIKFSVCCAYIQLFHLYCIVLYCRMYVAYSTFYLLGLILSMQVPFVGFQPIRTSEHMAAAGVFALLNAYLVFSYFQSKLTGKQFKTLFLASVVLTAGLVFLCVIALTYLGFVAPWSGRFYSLWDTGWVSCAFVFVHTTHRFTYTHHTHICNTHAGMQRSTFLLLLAFQSTSQQPGHHSSLTFIF